MHWKHLNTTGVSSFSNILLHSPEKPAGPGIFWRVALSPNFISSAWLLATSPFSFFCLFYCRLWQIPSPRKIIHFLSGLKKYHLLENYSFCFCISVSKIVSNASLNFLCYMFSLSPFLPLFLPFIPPLVNKHCFYCIFKEPPFRLALLFLFSNIFLLSS